MNTTSPKKPLAIAIREPEESESKIRLRAYELYEERGRADGHDLDDWLWAEAEMISISHNPL